MNFKNFNYIKLTSILLSGFVLISLTSCKENEQPNIPQNDTETFKDEEIIIEDDTQQTITDEDIIIEDNTQQNITNEENNIPTEDIVVENNFENDDLIVIEWFNELKTDINETLNSETANDIKDKCKGTFIMIVDFIFYDSEIKGIKFDDLTDSAKQEILKSANQIDELIMSKFPDYKEDISEATKNAYNKASELIKSGANKLSDFAQEKLGEENYQSIIEAKDELVYYTKNAFGVLSDFTSELWNDGKQYLKEWYENFRN